MINPHSTLNEGRSGNLSVFLTSLASESGVISEFDR